MKKPLTTMETAYVLLLPLLLLASTAGAAECESGWLAYKDELCFKSFPTLLSYHEAQTFCASQGSEISKASLVLVKEGQIQELLVNYTSEDFDYVWLGSKYDEEAAEFKWDDGEPVTYTNWEVDYPRITNASNACIELRPVNAKLIVAAGGKWADVNCQKRNKVICQRALPWSLQDAINEIIRIRKQHQEDLESLQTELRDSKEELKAALEETNKMVVPVGAIYLEYFNQRDPQKLWPSLQWEDVTSDYAGLFFRALGGSAASWGTTQTECAPRITRMEYKESTTFQYPFNVPIPEAGWSAAGLTGINDVGTGTRWHSGVRFNTENCEVRPGNQAVRIWKRIG